MSLENENKPQKRSAGTLRKRRVPLTWPKDRQFRILSIDGGGIRGIFPATFLAGLEKRYLGDASVAGYFDLIAGTSTGGIIALGLASGLTASELRDVYVQRGHDIFPPTRRDPLGMLQRKFRDACICFRYRYDRDVLIDVLDDTIGGRTLGEAQSRLCIPSFDGRYGEVYVFKTPHHPDFHMDREERMVKVALATAAAPAYFRPLQDGSYTFVDGGVWANNPVMIALVDALSCFSVPRERISILSLGCGDEPYLVTGSKLSRGGLWHWRKVISAAMSLQSQNVLGQAGLLVGANSVVRVDAPAMDNQIELDDWARASEELPVAGEAALNDFGSRAAEMFFSEIASPYTPVIS